MKLRVYNDSVFEGGTFLKAECTRYGISISAIGQDGSVFDRNDILRIYNDGTIQLAENINKAFGFQLDDRGRVKLTEHPPTPFAPRPAA